MASPEPSQFAGLDALLKVLVTCLLVAFSASGCALLALSRSEPYFRVYVVPLVCVGGYLIYLAFRLIA